MEFENTYDTGVKRFFPARRDSERVWVKDLRARGGGYWRNIKKSTKSKKVMGATALAAGVGLAALSQRRFRKSSNPANNATQEVKRSGGQEKVQVDYKKYEHLFRNKSSSQDNRTKKYMQDLLKRNEKIEDMTRKKDSLLLRDIADRMDDLRSRLDAGKKIWVKDRRVKGGGYWREQSGGGESSQRKMGFWEEVREKDLKSREAWKEYVRNSGGSNKVVAKELLAGPGASLAGLAIGAGAYAAQKGAIRVATRREKSRTGDIVSQEIELERVKKELEEKRKGPSTYSPPRQQAQRTKPERPDVSPAGYRMRTITQDSARFDQGEKVWVKNPNVKGGGFWRKTGRRAARGAKNFLQQQFYTPPPRLKKQSNKLLIAQGLLVGGGAALGVWGNENLKDQGRAQKGFRRHTGEQTDPSTIQYQMQSHARAKAARKESEDLQRQIDEVKEQLKERKIKEPKSSATKALPPGRSDSAMKRINGG